MSLRNAVDSKCKECIYDEESEGTWLKQVRDCTSLSCPLYPVRPGQNKADLKGNSNTKRDIPEGLRRYQEAKRASKVS